MEDLAKPNFDDEEEVYGDMWTALKAQKLQRERSFVERHRLAVAAAIGGTACAVAGVLTGSAVARRHKSQPRFA